MILLLSLQATPTFAQNDDFVKQFQQARQGMMDDYNKFRNTILTDYDKYMKVCGKSIRNLREIYARRFLSQRLHLPIRSLSSRKSR